MLYEWIVRGGQLMWPIVVMSVLALTIILERAFYWMRYALRRDPALRRRVYDGSVSADLELGDRRDPVAEAARWFRTEPLRGRLLADRLRSESRRGLGALETIASLSTSLGLFGTVVGVSLSFDSMTSGDASQVAGGLAVALFTTVAGLAVHLACAASASFFIFFADGLDRELDIAVACAAGPDARPEGREFRVLRPATGPRGELVMVEEGGRR